MTRRSELQRKLESLPAPEPPANLADRIKSEIPKDLRFNAEDERERLSGGIALNLRVAASFLVLISTVYLAMHVLSRKEAESPVATASRAANPAVLDTATQEQAKSESVSVTEPIPLPRQKVKKTDVAALEKKVGAKEEDAPARNAGSRVESLDAIAAVAPAAPAPPPAAVAEQITVAASAPAVEPQAKSALADFRRQPAADESIVQRFARPAAMPAAAVLDVEAVEEPFAPRRIVARASFDAGVAVKDLWVDTLLSSDANASARWFAVSWRWGSAQFANATRSAIVEFALPANDSGALVTVRAHYRVGDDPIEQSVEKIIRRSDVRAWSVASKRMKSATLAALWQNGGADKNDIEQAAREAGLDELVSAIEASR